MSLLANRRSHYDVVVIGARCAGAATALLLARKGMDVLVVDKSRLGSDTLSTHALMRGGVLQLHRWGILEEIRKAGTPPVSTTTFHYGDESVEIAIKPKEGIEALFAPRRTVLDPILAAAAETSGAEILRGPRLIDLIRVQDGRVRGVVIEDPNGRSTEISADLVVGADGVRSKVADLVSARLTHQGMHATGVIYGYWEDLDLPGYHWYFKPGAGTGSIRTNGGTLVFAGVTREHFWQDVRFDLEAGFYQILTEASPALAESLPKSSRPDRLRGYAGHNGFLRECWGPGWALVGDASYFKDPITAHGITDALRDAELLARAIDIGTPDSLNGYQELRNDLSLNLFRITDQVASLDWSFEQLEALHREMSEEMKREVRFLASLDNPASGAAISPPGGEMPKAS